ncbi:MAG TPA: peptidoglycan DD-metalloendopeptidase family protein [Candidatus Paceibacterota bacterium]|jgi:murein DD-endopeptidase MepM/ murein hydrolase activator NlpD
MAVGIAGVSVALLGLVALLIPRLAIANWPFSAARATGNTEAVLHDPKLALLEAAANSDPNPTKGGTPVSLSSGSALIASSGVRDEATAPVTERKLAETTPKKKEVAKAKTETAKKSATAKKTETPKKATVKKAAARTLTAVSSYFGNPCPGCRLSQGIHGNNGVDLSAPAGTPIYAAAAGTVTVAKGGGGYNGGYGNYVIVSHANGTQTLYAHMSRIATSGGKVGKGTLIGYVGNTGRSTGNHLHFEVRGGTNPMGR